MPRWLHVALFGLIGLVLGAVVGVPITVLALRRSFDTAQTVEASGKARHLAEAISEAMNVGVAMAPLGLIVGLVVGARTSRARKPKA